MGHHHEAATTHGQTQSLPITLYATPIGTQSKILGVRKPFKPLGHWAVCIQGYCYELTRKSRNAPKKDPAYRVNCEPEESWLARKVEQQRECVPSHVGSTAGYLSPETISYIGELIWVRALQQKYVYDENNCQVFLRLLVDLIGDHATRAAFPAFLDQFVKWAGIGRDAAFYTFAAGASVFAAAVSLTVAPVDTSGTAAVAFAASTQMVLQNSTALLKLRHGKEKFIKKAQEDIRKELVADEILTA
ncbi:uncharacterized protein F5Z01DRAFT_646122 [Emericellopsis atlantica]|uniref:Uncharacterized protein n=1 Tax=Emericellopsis atlantica TaxID=2614577 RepID=A0A9P7ZTH4_9HYPO|nr:uncharacterized protein F5Z01DRAFT_646122 [Emericellopsis atlantica]KAG9257512.1 hypothetical protein F5Z01DRAFT_646122 [Emericellopsis atlantica]